MMTFGAADRSAFAIKSHAARYDSDEPCLVLSFISKANLKNYEVNNGSRYVITNVYR